jgi:hypothetical protein
MAKKWQHRRRERCRAEYRPVREPQSYCSPRCKRAAAYGRERFQAVTRGQRKRRLEASDKNRPKRAFFLNRTNSLQSDQTPSNCQLRSLA